jgi:hypothetical protein
MADASKLSQPKIVLTDPILFGNEAAEDEREDVFYSYALERTELAHFADPERRLAVARAYKGEGKSALLRLTSRKIAQGNRQPIIIITRTADELAPEVPKDDYAIWVRAWKAAIVHVFAVEIGTQIGVAWTDDTMALVEESEKAGFRGRTIISAILDRLDLPEVSLGPAKVKGPQRKVLGTTNPGEAVKRWLKEKHELWLFVDDIDKNFTNTPSWKMKVASFFDACRALVNAIPELRIRSVVRPNVWTLIKRDFESLSHVEQYLVNLAWGVDDARHLLAKRIEAYLRRTGQWETAARHLRNGNREDALIGMVFESPIAWVNSQRPAHSVLHTLSVHRPRWMIELAKVAATSAVRQRHSKILRDDVVGELAAFGRRRIDDTVAEFKAQCPELDELFPAFNREKEQLSTDELLKIIDNKILTHLQPTISGVSGRANNVAIAALLYEIGLIYGRRDHGDGSYEHVSFADSPALLRSRTNLDAGLTWEVHPVFRQALEIRDREGREFQQPRRR